MPEIKIIKVFKLVNPNGDEVQLHFGMLKFTRDCDGDKDAGFRWMFTGKKIPMPIRSGEWFNGFPETTMLDWLKANGGWVVHAIWGAKANKLTVFDLPSAPAETATTTELNDADRRLVKGAVRTYFNGQNLLKCVRLYKMLTGETNNSMAMEAVKEILGRLIEDKKSCYFLVLGQGWPMQYDDATEVERMAHSALNLDIAPEDIHIYEARKV